MKIIKQVISTEGREYYEKHLKIVSCILPTKLTQKEIEVLAFFMSLDKNLIEEDMFNSLARKKVMEGLSKMSPGGLGNHLKSMIVKQVLDRHNITKRITIKSFLIPEESSQEFQIRLEKR
tara:strand:+ start:10131 stop:10490 length:360 start_codon:yes stop_codon:yes gene_type:complete